MSPSRTHRNPLLLLATGALLRCGDAGPPPPKAPATAAPPAAPSGPVAHAPWAGAGCGGAHGVAAAVCVNGVAIAAGQIQAAWAAAPNSSRTAVVQALVDAELVAQAAAAKGGWRAPELLRVARQTMVQLVLQHAMAAITPDTLALADIKTAYKTPDLRAHYDHVDAYFAVDAQILCCSGDPLQCGRRDDVAACIEKAAPIAQAAYTALLGDPPQTAEEMWGRTKALALRYPDLAAAEVHFFYDRNKPHDQQKGYDVMVEAFARPVTALQPGQLHEPIKSAFGWHIPYLHKIEPAMHKDWRDKAVRDEIAQHIVLPVQQRDSQRYVFGLLQAHAVQYFFERLDDLGRGGPAATGATEDL